MYFPSTHWSLLAQASLNGETAARGALDELCRRYWQPIRGFIRARGFGESEAEDLTQDFLLHLLEHAALRKADRTRGRFRSFLLGALVRFLCDERDRRQALKRGGGQRHLSVEGDELELATPEQNDASWFDREWALTTLENAVAQLETEYAPSERLSVLRRFLPGSVETPAYETAAAQLNLSLPALKTEVHRVRQRFKTIVRQEVAATVSAPHEIEQEMDYLHRVLSDRGI